MESNHAHPSRHVPPLRGRWDYSRAELIADGAVHAVGVVLAIAAGSLLLAFAFSSTGPGEYFAAIFYVVSLLTVMSVSFAYNMWPHTPVKWVLRRFDHAAIFLLIAGTYTPFLAKLSDPSTQRLMLAVVWSGAIFGMAVKLFLPGRFDRLAVGFYLAIGWSGVFMARELADVLSPGTFWLIGAGGVVYSLGVIFFALQKLRFHNAVWHGFVVTAAGLHMAAVSNALVFVWF